MDPNKTIDTNRAGVIAALTSVDPDALRSAIEGAIENADHFARENLQDVEGTALWRADADLLEQLQPLLVMAPQLLAALVSIADTEDDPFGRVVEADECKRLRALIRKVTG